MNLYQTARHHIQEQSTLHDHHLFPSTQQSTCLHRLSCAHVLAGRECSVLQLTPVQLPLLAALVTILIRSSQHSLRAREIWSETLKQENKGSDRTIILRHVGPLLGNGREISNYRVRQIYMSVGSTLIVAAASRVQSLLVAMER
jgi:hypothetical protein